MATDRGIEKTLLFQSILIFFFNFPVGQGVLSRDTPFPRGLC